MYIVYILVVGTFKTTIIDLFIKIIMKLFESVKLRHTMTREINRN